MSLSCLTCNKAILFEDVILVNNVVCCTTCVKVARLAKKNNWDAALPAKVQTVKDLLDCLGGINVLDTAVMKAKLREIYDQVLSLSHVVEE